MQQTDTETKISSFPFRSHTALLLATALPFLQPAYRHPIELAGKFLEFSETIRLYQEFHTGNTSSLPKLLQETIQIGKESNLLGIINSIVLDTEGLLCSLSKVCSGKEKEIVTMLLNLIRAKSIYENYGDILDSFMSSDTSEDTREPQEPSSREPAAPDESFSMPNMADMASLLSGGDLSSMLNKEQTDTLNLLKNLLDAE